MQENISHEHITDVSSGHFQVLGLLVTFFVVVVFCLCDIFSTLQIPEHLLALVAEKN